MTSSRRRFISATGSSSVSASSSAVFFSQIEARLSRLCRPMLLMAFAADERPFAARNDNDSEDSEEDSLSCPSSCLRGVVVVVDFLSSSLSFSLLFVTDFRGDVVDGRRGDELPPLLFADEFDEALLSRRRGEACLPEAGDIIPGEGRLAGELPVPVPRTLLVELCRGDGRFFSLLPLPPPLPPPLLLPMTLLVDLRGDPFLRGEAFPRRGDAAPPVVRSRDADAE